MRKVLVFFTTIIVFILAVTSCSNNKLIKNKEYRSDLETKFLETKDLANSRALSLFDVFDNPLSKEEEDALKFYFSSMPLSDLADYSGSFFLANIRKSLDARRDFVWSKSIPEDLFLHFVLPIRVNNENLDSFRIKYYNELFDRVATFTDIEEAVLEINHWCHEKVSYQGADIRTSGPLSTMLSARGRCGEESTFTVAALRTVGIPARQVYVPRWAHSDDNHAWVEVWINGDWKYLGACEPEPVLNRGWFTEPASRSMLIHSKTFGTYFGDEALVGSSNYSSEINNLGLYADIKEIHVRVMDSENNPVKDADVEFKLYNYSEYYTLASLKTDSKGISSFSTGLGDLIIWASKENEFAFKKFSTKELDTLVLIIGSDIQYEQQFDFEFYSPDVTKSNPELSAEQVEISRRRSIIEDSIRLSYTSSWIGEDEVLSFSESRSLDSERVSNILSLSMGNYKEIMKFLELINDNQKDDALDLLEVISSKDLRDTPADILYDHLNNARNFDVSAFSRDIYVNYILNPRIDNEIINPWREYIQSQQDDQTVAAFRENPLILSEWMNDNLRLLPERNYYNVPITPVGVLELGSADPQSRDILFVACCRACGIPARLEDGTKLPQYYKNDKWEDVFFADRGKILARSASLELNFIGEGPVPEYFIHFTIAKLEGGKIISLEYAYNRKLSDFTESFKLSPGDYALISGNRINDKEVLSSIQFFKLSEGESKKLDLILRNRSSEGSILGTINADHQFVVNDSSMSLGEYTGKGAIVAWIDNNREPTKHLLSEIQDMKMEFDKWDGSFIFISDPSNISESFEPDDYPELPTKTKFGIDPDLILLEELVHDITLDRSKLPVVLFIGDRSEILFQSVGYKVGYGKQIQKFLLDQMAGKRV